MLQRTDPFAAEGVANITIPSIAPEPVEISSNHTP